MKLKSNLRLLQGLCLSLTLFLQHLGCRNAAAAGGERDSRPAIGVILPLSGPYASGGTDVKQGFEIGIAHGSGQDRWRVLYADSKGEAQAAIGEFNKLVEVERAVAVYALRGPVGMALNPLSLKAKVSLFGGVGNRAFANNNEFAIQAWSASDYEGAFIAQSMIARGFKRPAVITVQDDWMVSVTEGFLAALRSQGESPSFVEDVLPAEFNFRSMISRIAANKPDAMFMNLGIAQFSPFLKQLRALKIDIPIYSNFWIAKQDVVDSAGVDGVEGVSFAEMDTSMPRLRADLKKRYQATPSGATLSGYVAAMLIDQVFAENPKIHASQEFSAALSKQSQLRTPDRAFQIKERLIQFPMQLVVMRGGKAVPAE